MIPLPQWLLDAALRNGLKALAKKRYTLEFTRNEKGEIVSWKWIDYE